MAMQLGRDKAFLLLVGASMVAGVSASTVIRKEHAFKDSLGSDLVFLGTNWLLAATLGWIGCRRLRELKRACSDEPWLKFLRRELIMTVVMVALLAGVAAMPEAWLRAAWDFFHEVELIRMLAGGGH
jgi:hypothetical protein